MAKLTKRAIEKLECDGSKHGTLFWDGELRGLGVRAFPSGKKTFVVKFRARSGRQRWLTIGAFGPLTAEQTRDRAKVELAKVVEGNDPAAERDRLRTAITLNQLCDLYLEAADAGLVLGRKGLPKRSSSISTDKSRLNAHGRGTRRGHRGLARPSAWRRDGRLHPETHHLLLIDTANRVADHIALQMEGEAPPSNIVSFQPRGRRAGEPMALAV